MFDFNPIEYIENLMDQGMSEENAERCCAAELRALDPEKYWYDDEE